MLTAYCADHFHSTSITNPCIVYLTYVLRQLYLNNTGKNSKRRHHPHPLRGCFRVEAWEREGGGSGLLTWMSTCYCWWSIPGIAGSQWLQRCWSPLSPQWPPQRGLCWAFPCSPPMRVTSPRRVAMSLSGTNSNSKWQWLFHVGHPVVWASGLLDKSYSSFSDSDLHAFPCRAARRGGVFTFQLQWRTELVLKLPHLCPTTVHRGPFKPCCQGQSLDWKQAQGSWLKFTPKFLSTLLSSGSIRGAY